MMRPQPMNGALLSFATDDCDAAIVRVCEHQAVVLYGPLVNPDSCQREVWMPGPEGDVVVVAGHNTR